MSFAQMINVFQRLEDPAPVRPMRGVFAEGDALAHTINVTLSENGAEADLTGATVVASFLRLKTNEMIYFTGSASGSVATVTTPEACYAVIGAFELAVQLVRGGEKRTIYLGYGDVRRTKAGTVIDPGDVVPDINTLLSKIAEMEAATAAANTATVNANEKAAAANTAANAANTAAAKANDVAQTLIDKEANGDFKGEPGQSGVPDDTTISTIAPWSSKQTVDRLCLPMTAEGNPVTLDHPVEGYPLTVKAIVEPVQHFYWMSKAATSAQVTTTGKNLLDLSAAQPGIYSEETGEIVTNVGSNAERVDLIACKPGINVYSYNGKSYNIRMAFFAADGTFLTSLSVADGAYATSPETAYWVGINSNSDEFDESQTVSFDAVTHEPYTGGKASPSPEYPQEIVDSIPAGSYYVPSTAPEGGYWRIDLDEALGGVHDCKDTLEIDSHTGRYRVIRNTAKIEYASSGNMPGLRIASNTTDIAWNVPYAHQHLNSLPCIANLLGSVHSNGNVFRVRLDRVGVSTLEEFIALIDAHAPLIVRYPTHEPIITPEQATHVTATTGLTLLDAVSMELTEPDPDHPCEIVVPEALELRRTGRNLLDYAAWEKLQIYNGNGVFENNGVTLTATRDDCYTVSQLEIPVVPGNTITISWEADSDANGRIYVFPNMEITMGMSVSNQYAKKISFKCEEWVTSISFRFGVAYSGTTISYKNIMINYGSTPLPYEPYRGDTYSVALPEGFAGGDVGNDGSVEGTWFVKTLTGDEMYTKSITYSGSYYLSFDKNSFVYAVSEHALCSHGKRNDRVDQLSKYPTFLCEINAFNMNLWGNDITPNAATFAAKIKEEYESGTPVQIAYQIATPTHATISPVVIPALPGENVITSNAQSLTVKARADTPHLMGKVLDRLAAVEAQTTNI